MENLKKTMKRFKVCMVPAFGLFIGYDDSGSIQVLLGCVGIEFNFIGLCRKQKPRFNLKKENQL